MHNMNFVQIALISYFCVSRFCNNKRISKQLFFNHNVSSFHKDFKCSLHPVHNCIEEQNYTLYSQLGDLYIFIVENLNIRASRLTD